MNLSDQNKNQIKDINALWNKVERRAKEAEQFNGRTVVAAINEMRYAGRRFVDAIELIFRDEELSDKEKETIYESLNAAKSALINADHDITDSICFVVIRKVSRTIEKHGFEKTKKSIHDFDEGYSALKEVQDIVRQSRETRSLRSKNYDKIDSEYLEKIMALYTEISETETLYTFNDKSEQYQNIRSIQFLITWISIIGSFASIVGLIAAYWMWCNDCRAEDTATTPPAVEQTKKIEGG